MRFAHSKSIDQLLREGLVATLRTYPYVTGQQVVIKIMGTKISVRGKVVKVVSRPTKEVLEEYLPISGFSCVDEWIADAKRLHKLDGIPPYLVVVTINQ